jgi:hypothetical protein
LRDVYINGLQSVPQANNQPEPPAQKAGKTNNANTVPKIAGVSFENRQGVIVAIGDRLYDKKELLKAAGFQWNKQDKSWIRQAA